MVLRQHDLPRKKQSFLQWSSEQTELMMATALNVQAMETR
jgi:hypothetical protein